MWEVERERDGDVGGRERDGEVKDREGERW